MNERGYQRKLIGKLRERFPGCVILKNDASYMPGVPDILILFKDMWAMLEVKIKDKSPRQPNQPYFVEMFNRMSFASFINPDNEEAVLNALQSAFESAREACLSKS